MIVTGLIFILMIVVNFIVSGVIRLIPMHFFTRSYDVSGLFSFLQQAFIFIPADKFSSLIHMIVFWYIAQLLAALVGWILKKIPLLNIE